MAFDGVGPVIFKGGVSNVTSTLGANDPEVGARRWDGGREYVFVYNDGGEDIDPGLGAVLQSGATGYSVTVSSVTSNDLCVGVCRNATLTTGTYGWLVTKGITPVEMIATSGSVSAGGLLELGANGAFAPYSNTSGGTLPGAISPQIGKALEAIVSSASGSAYISVF